MHYKKDFYLRIVGVVASLLVVGASVEESHQISPRLYEGMRWRMIGPFRGGRSLTASGVPGQPNTFYFGAVAGGVWKTTNAGETWTPVFDGQSIASIGALAVAPSDANVIYVGSGEPDMRSDITFGDGVYKSTDAGRTWKNIGLRDAMQIGRIWVNPRDANVVLVAALGHSYGPNTERGVFRTTDGGQNWQKVLYKDENTGAIDLAADPENPRMIYASLWNVRRTPWSQYPPVNGPGSGLYKSTDGGVTWTQITGHGLPSGQWGRVGLAVGRAKGISRVYALIDTKDGGLFWSDDDGGTWQKVGTDPRVRGRAWYFSGVTVDPQNPEVVYLPNVALYRSADGGKTFEPIKGAPGGDDYHFLWIDPHDSRRMILASDQGTVISLDGGVSWTSWMNQPTGQFYHVATDNQFPYYVYGAQQDSGTVATTSRSDFGEITYRDWYSVGAGESGYIAPDPTNPKTVFGGDTYGELFRFDKTTGQSQNISPLVASAFGLKMPDRKLRFSWTSPLVFSPHNSHVLYFGSQYVLKTSDRGQSWQKISPDLTGTSAQAGAAEGGGGAALSASSKEPLTLVDAKAHGYGVVYAIAPSPVAAAQIWVGTDTGLIHLTRDEGKTWENVTPPGLREWSRISIIDASHFDAGTAYAAVDRHRLDDYQPYIFRTHDFGKRWTKISDGIRAPAFVRTVRQDPMRKELLYAGTELGVYVSFDDGDHWQSLQLNLPVAPIHDLAVHGDDLVVATHGRAFWILDDLSPLRQASEQIGASKAHLFQPQTAIRLRANENRDTPLPPETPAGENPPAGAVVDYWIAEEPRGEVTLEILDSRGELVRRYTSTDRDQPPRRPAPIASYWFRPFQSLPNSAGMHRFVWDLRYPKPPVVDPEYSMATVVGHNTPTAPEGSMALPGEYQVRLTVDGHSYTQPLKLRMDPRVHVDAADLARQFELEGKICNAIELDHRTLVEVQQLRAEIKNMVETSTGAARSAVQTLDEKAAALAGEARPDIEEENGPKQPQNLHTLNSRLARVLNVVDSADAAPTQQAVEEFQSARQDLRMALRTWDELRKDIVALNELLRQSGAGRISLEGQGEHRPGSR